MKQRFSYSKSSERETSLQGRRIRKIRRKSGCESARQIENKKKKKKKKKKNKVTQGNSEKEDRCFAITVAEQ